LLIRGSERIGRTRDGHSRHRAHTNGIPASHTTRFRDAETGETLDEAEVSEPTSRLLNSHSDAECDHLLGANLTEASEGRLSVPLGSALGGMLKSVARPSVVGPASFGEALSLELEGLPDQELQHELTQRFIRLAAQAARNASEDAELGHPYLVAQSALASAADVRSQSSVHAHSLSSSPDWTMGSRREHHCPRGHRISFLAGAANRDLQLRPGNGIFSGRDCEVRWTSRNQGDEDGGTGRRSSCAHRRQSRASGGECPDPRGCGACQDGCGPPWFRADCDRFRRGVEGRSRRKSSEGFAERGRKQLDAVRSQLKLAEMVAPFVPGVGTGVAAALGAANALASGRPITDALVAAACGALRGGGRGAGRVRHRAEPRQKGKNLAEAALAAARDRLPGGPAARAAFDAAVALAKGKRLQDVAFAAAGRVLTPSPYAADALTFVKRVVNGQNVQHAALSVAGQRAVRQIHNSARLASHEMEFEQFDLEKSFATTKEMVQGIRELADC